MSSVLQHFLAVIVAHVLLVTIESPAATPLQTEHCAVQFSVNASDYERAEDGAGGQLRVRGTDIVIDANDYTVSLEDRTAHICYPMSDELKRCVNSTRIAAHHYHVSASNRTLTDTITGRQYPLGAYYVIDRDAIICTDSHNIYASSSSTSGRSRRRTCNYILLSPGEYRIDDEGVDGSVYLLPSNERLPTANYRLDATTNMVNACYPLTQDFLNCSSWWILENREIDILPNKELLSLPHQTTYGRGDYFLIDGNRAVTCTDPEASVSTGELEDVYVVHAIAHIVSAVCLTAAIVVHLLLPDLSYQRAPLLCHAVSLLVTYVCLATRQLGTPSDQGNCYLLFYVTYYFSTAAFCWLSVLAFDLWRISCSLRVGTEPYGWVNGFCNRKFATYAAVGWGVPVLLTLMVVLVDYYEHIQNTLGLYPYIAARCWFNERPSAFAFFYGPICALLTANFLLFALTVHNIWFASRHVQFTNMKLNKQLLVICFVVFLAMGLFWIMEIVSYSSPGNGLVWIIPDLINALQGVVVAVVYTCRPLTWRLLKERVAGLRSKGLGGSDNPSLT